MCLLLFAAQKLLFTKRFFVKDDTHESNINAGDLAVHELFTDVTYGTVLHGVLQRVN